MSLEMPKQWIEKIYTTKELSLYLQISEDQIVRWRREPGGVGCPGPAWFTLCRNAIRYRASDVEAWMVAKVESQNGASPDPKVPKSG